MQLLPREVDFDPFTPDSLKVLAEVAVVSQVLEIVAQLEEV